MANDENKGTDQSAPAAEDGVKTTDDGRKGPNPAIWLGLIGGFLAAFNNIVAMLALGVAQGPVVGLSTPLMFAFGRLMFPKLPAATIIYTPLVIISIFTLNLGPPGAYKFLYLTGAIAYDVIAYLIGIGTRKSTIVPLWKMLVTSIFYPLGLFLGAIMIVSWFTVEVPLMERGWAFIPVGIVFLDVLALLATLAGHRIYYKFIVPEIKS